MYGNKKEEELLNIPIRSDVIELFADLLLSENSLIHFKDYCSMESLISCINFNNITGSINNIPTTFYIEFIKFIIDLRINKKVNNIKFIRGKLSESRFYNEFNLILTNIREISNDDLYLVREFLSERLRFTHIFRQQTDLENFLIDLRTNGFDSLSDMSQRYENMVSEMFHNITSTKVNNNGELADVVLDEVGIRTLASDTYNSLNLAGNTLSLGVKKLNEKLGGSGGTRGETVVFGAPSGHGKSVLLLNTAWNIKRCNPAVETLDKTKKPLVIYFSAENTPKITYIRFAKLVLNLTKKQLKALEPEQVAMMLDAKLNGADSGNIKLEFVYRKSNSFSVQDIRSMILERENDGYEVISICLDYLKLLKNRKVNGQQEIRHILSDLSRDLADLAIEKNVLMISAFQLNRGAIQSNNLDLSFIAESLGMIDHVDYAYLFKRGFDVDTQLHYLQVFDGKERSTEKTSSSFESGENFFFIPFSRENTIEFETSAISGSQDSSTLIKVNTGKSQQKVINNQSINQFNTTTTPITTKPVQRGGNVPDWLAKTNAMNCVK